MHVQSNGGWLGGWLGGRLGGWVAAIQKTKFFTEVNNHHVSLIVSVAPFASSTNDKAS